MANKSTRILKVNSSPRAAIIDLLVLCEQGSFANDVVPARLSRSNFNDQDRALITKVVYSALRYQIRIDYALEKISTRPISKLDLVALCALRSVIAQLIDDFDMYAVVNETVKVLPFSMKGFVNALSRKAINLHNEEMLFKNKEPHVQASIPKWIYDEISSVFPDSVDEVIAALNSSTKVTLAPMVDEQIILEGALRGEIIPQSLLVRSVGDIANLDLIIDGKAIVVDQGSQLVAKIVDPQKNESVLDVCCAPGGKSLLMSKTAKKVIACDVSPDRLLKLKDSITRVKKDNVFLVASDARKLPFDESAEFDHLLIDAPCSGLGVLRRRPDARHRIKKAHVDELVDLQKAIITSAAKHVSQGGFLTYSVCTFTKAETQDIDEWMSAELPDFESVRIEVDSSLFVQRQRGYILAPTSNNDAMYVIKLKKSYD